MSSSKHTVHSAGSSELQAPELLAPAGMLASLLAGIQCGADAVYMGASRFSARAYAGNFSDIELAIGTDYAHIFGKKIYVTLNTLYRDDELDEVLVLFDALYVLGIDGVIVQDIGLLNLLTRKYPGFPVHASTQMTVHNSYHASFLKKNGVFRIVPARENSIAELKMIKEAGVEIETFIHGALCICYSGQCLFSGLVGSRSGNRGKCAQPCRKRYELLISGRPVRTEGQYLLSPKDLNASEELEKLISAGVDSFKIEGRMKKPDYVAGVVSVYRSLIDRIVSNRGNDKKEEHSKDYQSRDNQSRDYQSRDNQSRDNQPMPEEREILKKLFNRDFTDGYFLKNPENDLMSRKLPYNRGLLIGKITAVDRRNAQISVLLTADLSAHDGISIGDIGKNMNSAEDPRQGFIVRKMYSGRRICSKAAAGETVDIPAPVLFDKNSVSPPFAGDFVYKTSDFELQKSLSKKLPVTDSEDIEKDISDIAGTLDMDLGRYLLLTSGTDSDTASYSSADSFPVSELIEKMSPVDSLNTMISFECALCPGSPIIISAADTNGYSVTVRSEYIIEPAQKNPMSKEQAEDLLIRAGHPVFHIRSANVEMEGACFIPVGEFKNVRNIALQALLNEIILSKRRQPILPAGQTQPCGLPVSKKLSGFNSNYPVLAVCVYSIHELKTALNAGADRIYIGGDLFKDPVTGEEYGISANDLENAVSALTDSEKGKIFYKTPFVTKEEDFKKLEAVFSNLKHFGLTGILASNLGVFEFIRSDPRFDKHFRIVTDFPVNVFNSEAARLLFNSGAAAVSLSPELSISNINALTGVYGSPVAPAGVCGSQTAPAGAYNPQTASAKLPVFECQVHGRQQLMVTEHPLLHSLLSESPESFSIDRRAGDSTVPLLRYLLKDSKNYAFPVLEDLNHRNFIFNSKELNAFDLLKKLYHAGVSAFRIDGIGHSPDELRALISLYKKGLADVYSNTFEAAAVSADGNDFTRGSFVKGVE
ncbi:MAG: U32 family peptidase [Methanimicrococcus sp.]|nr:U32 family peptidase [Methanimicrococcus sp.]